MFALRATLTYLNVSGALHQNRKRVHGHGGILRQKRTRTAPCVIIPGQSLIGAHSTSPPSPMVHRASGEKEADGIGNQGAPLQLRRRSRRLLGAMSENDSWGSPSESVSTFIVQSIVFFFLSSHWYSYIFLESSLGNPNESTLSELM